MTFVACFASKVSGSNGPCHSSNSSVGIFRAMKFSSISQLWSLTVVVPHPWYRRFGLVVGYGLLSTADMRVEKLVELRRRRIVGVAEIVVQSAMVAVAFAVRLSRDVSFL